MSIPDSGSPYIYRQLDASSKSNLMVDLKDALVDSGWTLAVTDGAYVILTFTGLPGNNQTCTFDGVVYTFVTVLGAPANQVLIGATAAECAENLAYAIIEDAGTKGVKYSAATTAHPTCTASANAGACTVSYKTGGPDGNGKTASETLSNATLNSTTFRYGGYRLDSARCPSGLQMRVLIDDDLNATMIRIRPTTRDQSATGPAYRLSIAADRLLEFVGCKHQVFTWLLGSTDTQGCNIHFGTPYIRPANVAPKIASISNNGGNFQITTLTPHERVTGDHVYIAGAWKDGYTTPSAINGDHQVTVIDAYNLVLDGSTYVAENYDADSGLCGSISHISRAYWMLGEDVSSRTLNFRTTMGTGSGWTQNAVCLNQYWWNSIENNSRIRLKVDIPDGLTASSSVRGTIRNYGGYEDELEALITWPISSTAGERMTVGLLWNALVTTAPVPMDIQKTNYQGFNWINYMHNYTNGALWLITTPAV